ncbi:hypothetical protein AVEN_224796-1 [Araneus ventricosus]|uniref:Uncharacterized protein n=1 Tax=Araneus ventricosus TaxID=182803 RepID=A0A4Y2X2A6_ARAVE|nr:hypothetical protein AVEN_224796-1 [Araneus ventricosus]
MESVYFKRFTEDIPGKSHALQTITTEQYASILRFYELDEFILRGEDSVDLLRSVIPYSEIIKQDSPQDLYYAKVLNWPYLKVMCLKCANNNPLLWKYDEQENELFEYRLDTFSIFRPSSVFLGDCLNTVGH